MSETTALLVIAATWVTIGIVLSLVMGRRGYDAWGWLVVGALLGPLAIVLALTARPDRAREQAAITAHSIGEHTDVLVGCDGSPESEAAVRGVVDLFGDRVGRFTLATVIPFDAARAIEHDARERLSRLAAATGPSVDHIVLRGRPAMALVEHVAAGGYDVLAVGRVGHGVSKALLGSTATRLAHAGKAPVLLFGD